MRGTYGISEIAEIFNITTNKIRFYEKHGLLESKRDSNGYRIFYDEDIIKIQSILLYRGIGLSIEVIKNIMKNNEKKNYLTQFNNQWEMVNDEIHRLSGIRKSLEKVIDKIYEETDKYKINDDLLEIIEESNSLNKIKNEWEDKWDFNNWAQSYDRDVIADKGSLKIYKNYNSILQNVYNMAKKLNKKESKILEIGVGTGNLASKFLNDNFNIIGIDQSREMLVVAKEKYPKLKVRLGEFLKIPYENKVFDTIVSTYAFHHLKEEEKKIAIEEMIRVLKDDGKIIIGDLMFENKLEERNILKTLSKEQIFEIKDEYYSYIDWIKDEVIKYNKTLEYIKIDRFNYIIKICNRV